MIGYWRHQLTKHEINEGKRESLSKRETFSSVNVSSEDNCKFLHARIAEEICCHNLVLAYKPPKMLWPPCLNK